MEDKDSVLILRKGKEMLVFPGDGGYRIEWSSGTKLLQMTRAESGHLVIPCDRFADLQSFRETTEAFVTDHSQATSSMMPMPTTTAQMPLVPTLQPQQE